MIRRTGGEIKAYVEGYTRCYNDFTEYLKGRRSVADAIRKMDVLLTAVKASAERPTGKWERDDNGFTCTHCKMHYKNIDTVMGKPMWEYCPECGEKKEV